MRRITQSQSFTLLTKLLRVLFVVFLLGVFIYQLDTSPPLWFDEGWTLNTAKNWVEHGHYGQFLNGAPRSAGLSGHFPVVASVALSFKLFGVGVWQGRLPIVLYTLGAFVFIYILASRLFDHTVALITITVLLFMTGGPWPFYNPIIFGRQVLGEMPAILFLLAGYTALLSALRGSKWALLMSAVFFGIALRTKGQVWPFWTASLVIPGLIAILKKWRRQAIVLLLAFGGAWIVSQLIFCIQDLVVGDLIPGESAVGIYSISAFMPVMGARIRAIKMILQIGLPTIVGVGFTAWLALRHLKVTEQAKDAVIIRLVLLLFVGSWMGWYVVMGMWWSRYLVVPIFIGSIFVADLLRNLFSRTHSEQIEVNNLFRHFISWQTLKLVFGVFLIFTTLPYSLLSYYGAFTSPDGTHLNDVVDYLNTQTPPDSLVETYESELFFQLDRRYHYPPNRLSVDLTRLIEYGIDVPIEYDPLSADPDYLVLGPMSDLWGIYDEVLGEGEFRLLQEFSRYQVYARVRE